MNRNEGFQIIVRKKIPYVSEFFLGILSISCVILLLFLFFFWGSLTSNNEMKVVVGVISIPENIKKIIVFSAIVFPIFLFLYTRVIVRQKGYLIFTSTKIIINTKKNVLQIPISEIREIDFVDPMRLDEMPRGKFFVNICTHNLDTINIKLKDYNDSDNFIDNILKYDNLKHNLKNIESFNEPNPN